MSIIGFGVQIPVLNTLRANIFKGGRKLDIGHLQHSACDRHRVYSIRV